MNLAIQQSGAVTPAGVGVAALLKEPAQPVQVASLSRPGETWPVLRVDSKDPAFARWQKEPRLRRVSPLTFFLVEAAEQALAGLSPEQRARTGLIVAYSAGCVAYSRRFYEGIVKGGQRAASPALFPETVYNSPASHVAAVLGLNGAVYALVGDESAWISALRTASVWLRRGRVEQVVVLGGEEFDPAVLDAYASARWLRRAHHERGFLTSEGAAGVLVRAARPGDVPVITGARDGLIYRSKAEAARVAAELFREVSPKEPCHRTAQHNWFAALEKSNAASRPEFARNRSRYLGEAFAASAAWNTVLAADALGAGETGLLPVWGLNHQVGSLRLKKKD